MNKYGDLEAPTQYATVWNNGLPGFLIDRYNLMVSPICAILQRIPNIIIVIALIMDESKSPYKHKQLRDMVEYASFDNAESLRKETQWRMTDHHKKKLASNSMFNPWYMEWIRILTQ